MLEAAFALGVFRICDRMKRESRLGRAASEKNARARS